MSDAAQASALQDLWSILAGGTDAGEPAPARRSSRKAAPVVKPLSPGQAYAIVKKGISSRSLAPLGEYLGLGKGAVAIYLDLDRATALRKVAKNENLPTHAAESMLRLLELDDLAKGTFESPEEAAAWLRRSHPMLDGESPLECAKSGYGAQRVKDILVAIKYGGVV